MGYKHTYDTIYTHFQGITNNIYYGFHFLPVHPYFCPSIFVFTRPNDGWTGLYIKLCILHTSEKDNTKDDTIELQTHCFVKHKNYVSSDYPTATTLTLSLQTCSAWSVLQKHLICQHKCLSNVQQRHT